MASSAEARLAAVPAPEAGPDGLHAMFLGPYAENDSLLEKLVLEFLRDHVYWRRNFHPEDPPAIPTDAASRPGYQAFEARMRRELHLLSAALKRSVPFHSPRYVGHMASDLLLPGLAAQILTLPYNPNNVSEDAAPVTIDLEVQAGLQLARMIGYPDDPQRPDCAFGHLTSGGTLANYQALRLALALKAFPVALRAAGVPAIDVPEDDWAAFNLGPDASIALLSDWTTWLAGLPPRERRHWSAALAAERVETLGLVDFFARHPQLKVPKVLAPITAHYSWSKGLKLLGLGRDQLELLPERGMRLDPVALEQALERCQRERQPVLMAVAVLGTTEYGTVDPVDAVVDARDEWSARGLGFSVHVDGAWGGYLASLFRNPDGSFRPLHEVRQGFRRFPQPEVHAAFAALGGRTRSRSIHTSWATCHTGPGRSSAATTGRPRCWPNLPTTCSTRTRRATGAPRSTSRATAGSASSSRKAPSPVRRPRPSTSATRCCRSTMHTSASCPGRRSWRPRPSTRPPTGWHRSWRASRASWCPSPRTATWCAWRSIRTGTSGWRSPTPSCAHCTGSCVPTAGSRCRCGSSSAPPPRCAHKRWAGRKWRGSCGTSALILRHWTGTAVAMMIIC